MADLTSTAADPAQLLGEALGLAPGQRPFPWQLKLLGRFREGRVPRSLDIPTGLGKTATIAIWLLARALGGRLPRRMVYVVDRRAVVDQATEVAVALRGWLAERPQLRRALGLAGDLPISTLRGQFVDNRAWMEDPARPAVIVGTVDMVGSRLLFEGYASSRKIRPYQAGLLGVDTLFTLDEAHLVPPFEALIEAITATPSTLHAADEAEGNAIPRSRLLALSATGRQHQGEAFTLTRADADHPVVAKRLNATKRIHIEALEGAALPESLAARAWQLAESGERAVRCVVFVDKRADAEATASALAKLAGLGRTKRGQAPVAEVELLTGGRRVFERLEAARRLAEMGFVAGSDASPAHPCFLIATSAGEVGVDLDAAHMVSDLVALERMVQRLGRVNRRGEGDASVRVLVQATDGRQAKRDKRAAAEAARRAACLEALSALPRGEDGALDGSPAALQGLTVAAAQDENLRARLTRATTPAPLSPALERPTLDAWAMTSLKEHPGRPEVAPWLRGWVDDEPQTRVVWRSLLPLPAHGSGRRPYRLGDLERYFAAAPPHTSEVLETETYRVVGWLMARIKRLRKTAQKEPGGRIARALRDPITYALDGSGELEQVWHAEDLEKWTKSQRDRAFVGRTLVVPDWVAGLERGLLDAKAEHTPQTGDRVAWFESEEGLPPVPPFRVREIEAEAAPTADRAWRERERLPLAFSGTDDVTQWLVVEKWRDDSATEDDRSAGPPQHLDEHQRWAADRAASIAERLGLSEDLTRVVTLAARLHDEGKRADRWQRAFRAPEDGYAYAKTRGPIDVQRLDGYRHEFGSLTYVETSPDFRDLAPDHQDLVRHLVAAHHGFARPLIRTDGCDDAPPSGLEARAREVALRFHRLQDRWGPFGLAWLEALVRAADQQASRDNDERPERGRH